jgi:hypothetical protein
VAVVGQATVGSAIISGHAWISLGVGGADAATRS